MLDLELKKNCFSWRRGEIFDFVPTFSVFFSFVLSPNAALPRNPQIELVFREIAKGRGKNLANEYDM